MKIDEVIKKINFFENVCEEQKVEPTLENAIVLHTKCGW